MKDFFKLVESEINLGLFGDETLIFHSKKDAHKAIKIAESIGVWASISLNDNTGVYVSTQTNKDTKKWTKALKESKVRFSNVNEMGHTKSISLIKIDGSVKKATSLAESCFVKTEVKGNYIQATATPSEMRAWENKLQESCIAYKIIESDGYESKEDMISLKDLQTVDPGLAQRVRAALGKKKTIAPNTEKPVLRDNVNENDDCEDTETVVVKTKAIVTPDNKLSGDFFDDMLGFDVEFDIELPADKIDTSDIVIGTKPSQPEQMMSKPEKQTNVPTDFVPEKNADGSEFDGIEPVRKNKKQDIEKEYPGREVNADVKTDVKEQAMIRLEQKLANNVEKTKKALAEQKRIATIIECASSKNWKSLNETERKREISSLEKVMERAQGNNKVKLQKIINTVKA